MDNYEKIQFFFLGCLLTARLESWNVPTDNFTCVRAWRTVTIKTSVSPSVEKDFQDFQANDVSNTNTGGTEEDLNYN